MVEKLEIWRSGDVGGTGNVFGKKCGRKVGDLEMLEKPKMFVEKRWKKSWRSGDLEMLEESKMFVEKRW